MKEIVCLFGLVFLDVAAIGYMFYWYFKMKRRGYKFCYVAPTWRALIDLAIIILIISSEIYYVFSYDKEMIMLVMLLFFVFVLPPRRYVFCGEQGTYIGKMYFTLDEQLKGQVLKNYPFHRGRVKVYIIQLVGKNSEPVLLSMKKLKVMWKEDMS